MTLLDDHRKNLDNVSTLAIADVVGATELLKDRPLPELAYQLRLALPEIAATYASVAETLAIDYYDNSRAVAGVESVYEAQRVDYDARTPMDKSIGYSIAQKTKGSTFEAFQSILAGSIQRSVVGADRETISFNIATDPDGTEYERVPSGTACSFCLTMAAVAEVRSNDFFSKYHDFCRCTSRPVFTGQAATDLPIYSQVRSAYSLANKELQRQREAAGFYSMKTRDASRKFPDLTMTTENHLRLMRQITGWR